GAGLAVELRVRDGDDLQEQPGRRGAPAGDGAERPATRPEALLEPQPDDRRALAPVGPQQVLRAPLPQPRPRAHAPQPRGPGAHEPQPSAPGPRGAVVEAREDARVDGRVPRGGEEGRSLLMRLAFVVQRYGLDIAGGAEYHCRLVAEHLARHAEVEVFTTCAADYVTWANRYPEGREVLNGIPVRRFKVKRPRDPDAFADWSDRVFRHGHEPADEQR